jgi:hypothetical protein
MADVVGALKKGDCILYDVSVANLSSVSGDATPCSVSMPCLEALS